MTVLTQTAVAKYLGFSRPTISKWTKAGIIPHKKGYGGRPYYVREKIDKWLSEDK